MTCRWVDGVMTRGFHRLGLAVARSPGYFIVIPILLTLLCISGYQRIHYEMDPEYLFSPTNGRGKYERAVVESYFKMNYSSRFNPTRLTRPGRFGRVIIIPKQGDDLLSVEAWAELRILDEIIRNTSIVFGEDKLKYTFSDICAKWEDLCFENDILNLDAIMPEVVKGELNLTFPIMINPVTWDMHTFPVYFGGTVLSEDGTIISVPSLQLAYFVNADTKFQDERGAAWEDAFLDAVGEAEDTGRFKYISTARFASRTLDMELERNTQSVVPYFGSTFLIMAIFSTLTCTMSDWVRSKPLLGLMGNVSAVMGTLAGFGLAMYCGVDFIGINLVSPLLMCSIGIDDTFVMLAAWRRTSVTDPVPIRMANTMAEAAVSITITSVTDIVSFWIGMLSPFPSIQIFCLYSSFAVAFIFLWHITFFAACMALSGYAEHNNRHSIVCMKVLPVSLAADRSWFYRIFCTGGVNPKDPDNPSDNPENLLMAFFRDSLAPKLSWWPTKLLVLTCFAFYLAGACYGLTNLQEGLQRRKLSREDSYSVIFYDREDYYFRDFPYRMQVIISDQLEYSNPVTQERIENLTRTFEASPYISTSLYTESWIRSFVSYVRRNQDYLNVSIDTEDDFINTLNELWLFKPNPFSLDVKFSKDGKRIEASRFLVQAVDIIDGNMEKDMVRDLRKICDESDLNVTVFHPYFVFFDQFELVKPTSIQSMVVGAVIMSIISFIFIPNILCSLWVAFCIVSIETGVAGYMALWDVNLDSISMINLIMCIGFSVDFTAHICYAYMSSKSDSSKDKIQECLYALGLPIFQGAISTILGVIALILAQSYIFMVFFKMIFLVILFGALHGMFLLPVLLSLFGPGACRRSNKQSLKLTTPGCKGMGQTYCLPHPQLQAYPKHLGLPLHGLPSNPRLVMSSYDGNSRSKFVMEPGEKDQGLGTSGEDSSESSGSRSRRREIEDEEQRRRYVEGWRKSQHHVRSHSYHNGGYLSDEECRQWRRSQSPERHRRSMGADRPVDRPHSNTNNHHRASFIGEKRFP